MAQKDRTIRVFVSSTFLDMFEGRDGGTTGCRFRVGGSADRLIEEV